MIYITQDKNGNDVVNITRGDDGALEIPLKDEATGEAYTLHESEYIVFTVRALPTEESEVLIESQSEPGSNIVEFTHEQTAVEVGEYSADAQLMTRDGKRYTVWPVLKEKARTDVKNSRKNFCVTTEVCQQ